MNTPTVFISATKEDLEKYRNAARDAAIKAGFHPIMMEYFAAGGNPPLKTCMDKIKSCDVLVAIVAHRYGWIPADKSNKDKKSISWLECMKAYKDGKQVLAFLVDDKYQWPEEHKETYRITKAMTDGTASQELYEEVNTAVQKLKEYKEWLQNNVTTQRFTDPHSLGEGILHALNEWQKKHQKTRPTKSKTSTKKKKFEVPPAYKDWLSPRCCTLELLAHLMQEGHAPPRLSSVYVPAPTVILQKEEPHRGKYDPLFEEDRLHLLLDRFADESLYIPGIAGSGKSTFTRWVVYLLCQGSMPGQIQLSDTKPVTEKYPDKLKDRLPILVPFHEFWPFLPNNPGQREMSSNELESAMAKWASVKLEGIDWETIEHFITNGRTVLLFDGVDEIPVSHGGSNKIYYPREMIISALKNTIPRWLKAGNRVLVTSRPYGMEEGDARAMGLIPSEITDLPGKLQHLFIKRWFAALAHEPEMTQLMIDHLAEREELSELTGNPVMLMAMCILFPEGRRLPQDKAELYQKTIVRMLYNRYGDAKEVEKVQHRLSVIAHGMHTGTGPGQEWHTPRAEVTLDEIDRIMAHYMEQQTYTEKGFTTVANARDDLLCRSGFLVQKEHRSATFYHFSFQDYLASRRMIQLAGDNLHKIIKQYSNYPEWRQALAFAFGSKLQDEGSPEKVIDIIEYLLEDASLENLARLVLAADMVQIIYGKEYGLGPALESKFKELCLEAIAEEVPVLERYDLARALGIIGDPRIVIDLRESTEGRIRIPAGMYRIGEKKKQIQIDRPFFLSKYPVTNSQYAMFIKEGGYGNDKWWSKEGQDWRDKNNISKPLYWHHGKWNGPNLPVVGVSWYEAEAFCKWAGGRLPTEYEWEAAARGPEGNEYAWGDKWEDGTCNSRECGLKKTSPVGMFPRSRSQDFKLEDMTGNVWEWCADWYDKDKDTRVLRGGSVNFAQVLRCSFRYWNLPLYRLYLVGFRMVFAV